MKIRVVKIVSGVNYGRNNYKRFELFIYKEKKCT